MVLKASMINNNVRDQFYKVRSFTFAEYKFPLVAIIVVQVTGNSTAPPRDRETRSATVRSTVSTERNGQALWTYLLLSLDFYNLFNRK